MKRLSILIAIVVVAASVLVGSVKAAPVQNDLHNYAVARVIESVNYPGNNAVFNVDLIGAEHLYNAEDPYLSFLPVGTVAEPGDILVLDCTTDPTEWVANILNCDLVTVIN